MNAAFSNEAARPGLQSCRATVLETPVKETPMNSNQNITAMAEGASPVPPASILSLYQAWDGEYKRINRKGSGFTPDQMAALCKPHTAMMNQICSLDSQSPLDVLAKVVAASYKLESCVDSGWADSIRDEALAMLESRSCAPRLSDLIATYDALKKEYAAAPNNQCDDVGDKWIDAYYAIVDLPCHSTADAISKCQFVLRAMDGKDMGCFEEEKVIRSIAALEGHEGLNGRAA